MYTLAPSEQQPPPFDKEGYAWGLMKCEKQVIVCASLFALTLALVENSLPLCNSLLEMREHVKLCFVSLSSVCVCVCPFFSWVSAVIPYKHRLLEPRE